MTNDPRAGPPAPRAKLTSTQCGINRFSVGTYELGPLIGMVTAVSHEITHPIAVSILPIRSKTSRNCRISV